ncbi:MAG: hypothetical protein ACK557_00795, partial [Planctomycetota bacterium]
LTTRLLSHPERELRNGDRCLNANHGGAACPPAGPLDTTSVSTSISLARITQFAPWQATVLSRFDSVHAAS